MIIIRGAAERRLDRSDSTRLGWDIWAREFSDDAHCTVGRKPERRIVHNAKGEINMEDHMTEPASVGEKEKVVKLMKLIRKFYREVIAKLFPRYVERRSIRDRGHRKARSGDVAWK
jgi:hypothetical protein